MAIKDRKTGIEQFVGATLSGPLSYPGGGGPMIETRHGIAFKGSDGKPYHARLRGRTWLVARITWASLGKKNAKALRGTFRRATS